ncbi:hypothetical protein SAMN02745218_01966 [Desulfofundulus australicus DSM 11792]|uniref:Uncharacterized protein n=1 Tax=Desulfofundulus australicus DSM 11792 TaxID=1121425 RepID=A0A1M5AQ93_9FIRM|nr:hypothetical protein [Desulfofundulus australicus]SHF32413.1 hypothetical protein SAMN02745218_01966 [Desulfofundulus australicus DSM 11792]
MKCKLKLKAISLLLVLVIALSFSTTAYAVPSNTLSSFSNTYEFKNDVLQLEKDANSLSTTATKDGEVQPAGKLGFLVKLALQTIKSAIKYGGEVLEYILKRLDPDTANYLTNNISKITKALDNVIKKIDDAQDYATATIRSMLFTSLTSVGVPGYYALPIADAIARTVDWLLL